MRRSCRRVLLVQPPYGDFTYPYHSLSYVAAPLKAAGYDVDVIDLNIVWFRNLFQTAQLKRWSDELGRTVDSLQSRAKLSIAEQDQLVRTLRCQAACSSLEPEAASEVLRSDEFYDFSSYLWARSQVRIFESLLSELYPPYEFFSAFAVPPYEPDSRQLVARATAQQRLIADTRRLLEERYGQREYLFCGVTFPFSAHLVPGLAVFRALRDLFPDACLVAGGTAVADIYKYQEGAQALTPFRDLCDLFYVGEAETGVVRLADWCRGEIESPPAAALKVTEPDVIERGREYVSLGGTAPGRFVPYHWESAPPDYSWIDWSLYLSPEKRVNYAPARGCFWNQCTFCDYGLNTGSPTAPSRTMDVGTCVSQLATLSEAGIRRVYLAVDAIPPKFLNAFAGELCDRGVAIGWATQFFLTRQFTTSLVGKLAESGLSIASFGLESGSSRVLERMGKGKNRVEEELLPAFQSFRASPIGLQPLFFYGFPGETAADRRLTIELLQQYPDVFSTVSKGGLFSLLAGSIAAKQPKQFGISNPRRRPGENISGDLEYDVADGEPLPTGEGLAELNGCLPYWNLWERPWAGGIDTLHTQLYVERYGRGIFRELQQQYKNVEDPWGSMPVSTAFDLEEVMENAMLHNALKCSVAEQAVRTRLGVSVDGLERILPAVERRDQCGEYTFRIRLYREI